MPCSRIARSPPHPIPIGSHRQHALYIWDKATGSLVKMLTGQKGETLLDVAVCLHGSPGGIKVFLFPPPPPPPPHEYQISPHLHGVGVSSVYLLHLGIGRGGGEEMMKGLPSALGNWEGGGRR